MNSYITLACVLAVAGLSHGSAIGWDGLGVGGLGLGPAVISSPIVVPAAVSTANQWKAAPIPVIRTISAPIITAPVIRTIGVSPYGLGLGGLGLSGYGLGHLGSLGLKSGLGYH